MSKSEIDPSFIDSTTAFWFLTLSDSKTNSYFEFASETLYGNVFLTKLEFSKSNDWFIVLLSEFKGDL